MIYIDANNNFISYTNQETSYTFEVNGKNIVSLELKYLKEVDYVPVSPIWHNKQMLLFNYDKGVEVFDIKTKTSKFLKIRAIQAVHFFSQDLCLFLKGTKAIIFDFKEFRIVDEMNIPDGWSPAPTSNGILITNNKSITYRLNSDPFHPYKFKIKKEIHLPFAFSCDDKQVNILCTIGNFGEPEEFVEIVLDLENQTSEITVFPTMPDISKHPSKIWFKWFKKRKETAKINSRDLRYVKRQGKENMSMFFYLSNKYDIFTAIRNTNFHAFENECTDKAIVDEYIKMFDCLYPMPSCFGDYETRKENLMSRAKTLDRLISDYLK